MLYLLHCRISWTLLCPPPTSYPHFLAAANMRTVIMALCLCTAFICILHTMTVCGLSFPLMHHISYVLCLSLLPLHVACIFTFAVYRLVPLLLEPRWQPELFHIHEPLLLKPGSSTVVLWTPCMVFFPSASFSFSFCLPQLCVLCMLRHHHFQALVRHIFVE